MGARHQAPCLLKRRLPLVTASAALPALNSGDTGLRFNGEWGWGETEMGDSEGVKKDHVELR